LRFSVKIRRAADIDYRQVAAWHRPLCSGRRLQCCDRLCRGWLWMPSTVVDSAGDVGTQEPVNG